jgi:gliding motility-associated-like protein
MGLIFSNIRVWITILSFLSCISGSAQSPCAPQINLGSNINFCAGNSISLNASSSSTNTSYLWSTGATTSSISVSSTGSYWVVATNSCGSDSDTIDILTSSPLILNLGPDQTLCTGNTLSLSTAFQTGTSYTWSTGSSSNMINVNSAGTYWLRASNACGIYTDTIVIDYENPVNINLGPNRIICLGTNINLNSGTANGTRLWSNGSTGTSISISSSGTYWVEVTNACGLFRDTVSLNFVSNNQIFNSDTLSLCPGTSLSLTSNLTGSYLWSTGANSNSISVNSPGLYWLEITDSCVVRDSIYIKGVPIPAPSLGADTVLCSGQSLNLNDTSSGFSRLWSDGTSGASLNITSGGTFWLRLDNGCQFYYDTININFTPRFTNPLADTSYICAGNAINFNAANAIAGTNYLWSNGIISPSATYNSAGNHWLILSNSCFTDTFPFVIVADSILNISLGSSNVTTCASSHNLQLQGTTLNDSILWSTGQNQLLSVSVNTSGKYWVRVTNKCGTYSDTLDLAFISSPPGILIDSLYLCSVDGSSVTAEAEFQPFTQWQWSNGANTQSTILNSIGYHSVMAFNACDTISDSVYVKSVSALNFSLGPDTTLCPGQRIRINFSSLGADSAVWENGSRNTIRNLNTTGTYHLSLFGPCGVERDTIQIIVIPALSSVLTNQEICLGDSVFLDASQSAAQQYLWNTGDTNSGIWVKNTNVYSVSIRNFCETLVDSANVLVAQPIVFSLGADTTICEDDAKNIDLSNLNADAILWSDGSTALNRSFTNSGTYSATLSNACGSFTDTITIAQSLNPIPVLNDTTICSGTTISLDASQIQPCTYFWSNGSTASAINVNSAATYWVSIRNTCDTIVDSVSVSVVQNINFSLGADTAFCLGGLKSVNLSLIEADSISWSDGSTLVSRDLFSTGQYIVRLFNACGVFSDTINIQVTSLPVPRLSDTSICTGSIVNLNAVQSQATSYLWSNGSTASAINVTNGGTYWVSIRNSCDTLIDSVNLIEDLSLQAFNLGNDTIYCAGTLILDAGNQSNVNYLWQDGSTGRYLSVSGTGTYHVKVENSCGILRDTINVLVTGPPQVTLGNFVQYCNNNTLTLSAQNQGSSYLWSTGDTTQTIIINSPGPYWVEVTNLCGIDSDTIIAQVELQPQVPFLQNDTIICLGDTIELSTGYSNLASLWNNGSRDFRLEVDQAGTYSAIISNSCGNFFDTVNVSVWSKPEPFDLGADTNLCANTSIINIGTAVNAVSYLWNTGSVSDSITVSQPGTYILTTTDFCGYTFSDTIIIATHFPLTIDFGPDLTICTDDSIVLDAGVTEHDVLWNDGFIGSVRSISVPGLYIANSTNSCGRYTDTIEIFLKPVPDFSDKSFLFCTDDSLLVKISEILDTSSFDYSDYSIYWQDGGEQNERYLYEDGDFTLIFEDQCKAYPLNFRLETKLCFCPLFIPSAFSPNSDGKNEAFGAVGDCEPISFNIQIFNRWGETTFRSSEMDIHWDGSINGKPAPQGAYLYRIVYEWSYLKRKFREEQTGTVSLLR